MWSTEGDDTMKRWFGSRARAITMLATVLAGLLAAASPSSAAPADIEPGAAAAHGDPRMSGCATERNEQVVSTALRVVFAEHRVDQIDRFFADDFVQHSPYAAPGGREELKQWWAAVITAIPDVTTTMSQTTALGLERVPIVANCTDVVTFRTVSGTIAQDLPEFGIIGVGKYVEFRVADIFRLRDGMITAHWEVADTGPLVLPATGG
jgi:predicted SnoaL-like aldol condensation-catalyzing enzyme